MWVLKVLAVNLTISVTTVEKLKIRSSVKTFNSFLSLTGIHVRGATLHSHVQICAPSPLKVELGGFGGRLNRRHAFQGS